MYIYVCIQLFVDDDADDDDDDDDDDNHCINQPDFTNDSHL